MKKTLVTLLAGLVLAAGSVQGQPLINGTVYWNADTTTPTTFTTISGTGVFGDYFSGSPTFSQFNNYGNTTLINSSSASSGYTGVSGGNNFGLAVGPTLNSGPTPFSASGAAFEFSFTLTNSAQQFSLESFSFGSRRTGTGPQAIRLVASNDSSFSTTFTVLDITAGQTNATWVFNNGATSAFTSTGNQVFFRLYGYNGQGNAAQNTANWRIDDITLGYTVIPEPSTYLLIALGLGGLVALRRFRPAAKA